MPQREAGARRHIRLAARALQEAEATDGNGTGLFPEEAFHEVAKIAKQMKREWDRHGYWIEPLDGE